MLMIRSMLQLSFDGAHAEELCNVNDANAAQLDIVPQHLGRIADQLPGRDLADFDRVVRNQTVPALDQLFDGGLALSDAAVAVDQNALAGNFPTSTPWRVTRGQAPA